MKKNKLELLAPAGSYEALIAAVHAGADAVYISGKAFGARAFAENFDKDELVKAVQFCHLHRVRLFVTVNTLVDDSEFDTLADYLVYLNNICIDGVIVQDLGVVRIAKKIVPDLPLHASTQMTITNSLGVEFAKNIGMERAVVARELSLNEIQSACSKEIEIETFIHGALCVCYSGQCLMSSLIGGRSGNRGACAQPCRLPYTLIDENGENVLDDKDVGQYLLSPKDFNTLELLPKLIESGVTSFKIEGRMKKPEYVAIVVDIYRRAIDSYISNNYFVSKSDKDNIKQIFNRDFTSAYLVNRPGITMMSHRRPNNRGILIGRIIKIIGNKAEIKLEKDIHIGDGLEFWVTVGGRVGIVVEKILQNDISVMSAKSGTNVIISVPKGVRQNDRVFRTLDIELTDYAHDIYKSNKKKTIAVKIKVSAHLGEPLKVELADTEGNIGIGLTDFIVEKAKNRPLNDEILHKQLERLGTTEYETSGVDFEYDENIMAPLSEINDARRRAVDDLNKKRLQKFEFKRGKVNGYSLPKTSPKFLKNEKIKISVHCDTIEKINFALDNGADRIIFGGDFFSRKAVNNDDFHTVVKLCHQAKKEIAFATPRIVKEGQLSYFEYLFNLWAQLKPDYVYINNNSLVEIAKKYNFNLWADNSLNIFNSQSLQFWQENNAFGASISNELTMSQIENLAHKNILPLECLVQGKLEMMVSEYCIAGSFLGDVDKGECRFKCQKKLYLEDRQKAKFPLAMDQNCRMHILNSVDLSLSANIDHLKQIGISLIRIDGRTYESNELADLVKLYRDIVDEKKHIGDNNLGTTRGHYYRGVM